MKVLHVIPSVAPSRGGPSFVIRTLTRGLAERGIETHVATTDDNGPSRLNVPLDRPVVEDGVVYWYFPRQTRFYVFSLPFTKWLWRHAGDYDLIHIHTLFSYCSNAAAWVARSKGVPYIIRPLGVLNRWGMNQRRPWLKRLSFALIEKSLLGGAACVQYTAEQERMEASELGFPHTPVVIPNPVEISEAPRSELRGRFRARYPQLAGRRIVLFLSRIDRKKGLDLLIPAFRLVVDHAPGMVLVIAGDGDAALIDTLQRQAHQFGIDDSVIWTGFLNGGNKFEAFADADVFVLPSYSENFGIAAVEAMAMGVPIVLTDQVAIHREVAECRAGSITSASVGPLAEAIAAVVADNHLRLQLAANAHALARSRFSRESVIGRMIQAYETVLQGTSPVPLGSQGAKAMARPL
jgi:glycosyltransferase involved in cell wall biosynthesis